MPVQDGPSRGTTTFGRTQERFREADRRGEVIQPLDSASAPSEATKKSASAPAGETTFASTSFADVHAAAVARDKRVKPAHAAAVAEKDATSPARERIAVPEGETWEATKPGAHYARIVSGARKGQFINLA